MEPDSGTMVQLFGPAHQPTFHIDVVLAGIADAITLHLSRMDPGYDAIKCLQYKRQRTSKTQIRRIQADFLGEDIEKLVLEFRGVCEVLPATAFIPYRVVKLGELCLGSDTFLIIVKSRDSMSAWSGDTWPVWSAPCLPDTSQDPPPAMVAGNDTGLCATR